MPAAATGFLGEPQLSLEWKTMGLPGDAFTLESAMLAVRSRRWPLLVDPQVLPACLARVLHPPAPAGVQPGAFPAVASHFGLRLSCGNFNAADASPVYCPPHSAGRNA